MLFQALKKRGFNPLFYHFYRLHNTYKILLLKLQAAPVLALLLAHPVFTHKSC
nr:MAG TPA: hypothetical protein [Caudoviricetes sp.]